MRSGSKSNRGAKRHADNEVHAAIWTTVEPAAAIVAACIPSVRSLYRNTRSRSQPTLSEAEGETCSHGGVQKWASWLKSRTERSNAATGHSAKPIDPNWTSWLKSKTESEAELPITQDVAEIETGGARAATQQTEAQWAAALRPISLAAALEGTRGSTLASDQDQDRTRGCPEIAEGRYESFPALESTTVNSGSSLSPV